jgi:hypothetical protein
MAENKKLIPVAEAAEILGRSKSAIYAALNASPPRLHYHDVRRRLLLRAGLEERFNRSTRPRADCTRPAAPEPNPHPPEQHPIEADQWELIAEHANELIDASLWTEPPPWTAERWAGLAGVIDLARLEAEAEVGDADAS